MTRVWLQIAAALLIAGVCNSVPAFANEVISIGLIPGHLQWSDNEMIVGGKVILRGGQFETRNGSGTGPLRDLWPFTTNVYYDRVTSASTLTFSLKLAGQPRGILWLKNAQLYGINDWVRIEVSNTSHLPLCPSESCPITIDGELLFDDPNRADFYNVSHRLVRVSTKDFVFKDVTINIDQLRSKAEAGDIAIQYKLGTFYYAEDTPGIVQNYSEAYRWFREAADMGYAPAQNKVGQMYLSGLGRPNDFAEAIKWWRMAAQNGDAEAQDSLSTYLWLGGQGVAPNHAESEEWLRKSADQGNTHAQDSLGSAYETGQDVKQDYEEAYFWYLLAAKSAERTELPAFWKDEVQKPYTEEQARVAEHLTARQIEEVKSRVSRWKPVTASRN